MVDIRRYRRLLLKDKAMLVQLEDEAAGKVKVRGSPQGAWRP